MTDLDDIVLAWITAARLRKLGDGTIPLLWAIADHVSGLREIPAALREKCGELLARMKQTDEVKRVKEACGYERH